MEVVQLFRQHAGKDVLICVDANNDCDLVGAQWFLEKVGDADLIFVEELFPETAEECLALTHFISEHGGATLLADGDPQHTLEVLFLAVRAIDVFQGGMNCFSFEGIPTEVALAKEQDLLVASHSWKPLVWVIICSFTWARAVTNVYRASPTRFQAGL